MVGEEYKGKEHGRLPGTGSSPRTPGHGGKEEESAGMFGGGYIVEKDFVNSLNSEMLMERSYQKRREKNTSDRESLMGG